MEPNQHTITISTSRSERLGVCSRWPLGKITSLGMDTSENVRLAKGSEVSADGEKSYSPRPVVFNFFFLLQAILPFS